MDQIRGTGYEVEINKIECFIQSRQLKPRLKFYYNMSKINL